MKTEFVNISSHFYENIIFITLVIFLLPILANAKESIVHGKIIVETYRLSHETNPRTVELLREHKAPMKYLNVKSNNYE